MKLFLDDVRDAPEGWHVIRNPWGILNIVADSFEDEIEAISFDHDLGAYAANGVERTGYWVLCQLEEMAYTNPRMARKIPYDLRIHSANSSAYKKMTQAIESIRKAKEVELDI